MKNLKRILGILVIGLTMLSCEPKDTNCECEVYETIYDYYYPSIVLVEEEYVGTVDTECFDGYSYTTETRLLSRDGTSIPVRKKVNVRTDYYCN